MSADTQLVSLEREEISLAGFGPHAGRMVITVPEDGGVVELHGPNGGGKTHALGMLSGLIGGKAVVSVNDDVERAAANWGAAKFTLGKRIARSGELDVLALDGLDVSTFVDPGLKDPDAADAVRIKCLLRLAGVQAQLIDFYDLLGGKAEFERVITTKLHTTDDPCLLASEVKRAIEVQKRSEEERAERAAESERSNRLMAEGVDVSQSRDGAALQCLLESAVGEQSRLRESARSAERIDSMIAQAKQSLDAENSSYGDGPTVERATEAVAVAKQGLEKASATVELQRQSMLRVTQEAQLAVERVRSAERFLRAAEKHEQTVMEWQKQIDTPQPAMPSSGEITKAGEVVVQTRLAIERAAIVRQAVKALARADVDHGVSAVHRARAEKLHGAAVATEDVLTSLIARLGTGFTVRHGRLRTKTDRGDENVAELSQGERVKLGIDVVVQAVPQGSPLRPVLVLSGQHWNSLQPSVKAEVNEHAKSHRVLLFTEVPTDDEGLFAVPFSRESGVRSQESGVSEEELQ